MSIPPSLLAARPCAEHRKTPGSHEPGAFVLPHGRKIPAAAGVYGVRVLGLTPRRAVRRGPSLPRFLPRGTLFLLL